MTPLELAGHMLPGAVTTIWLTVTCMLLALIPAFIAALSRVWDVPVLGVLATAYVEFIRSTPLILQLFFAFYALPFVGLGLPAVPTAIGVLTIHFGAYQSEIVRAAMLSVPQPLNEAARVLGMPRALAWRRVVMPIALRVVFPPLGNSLLELFKSTSFVSLIGVHDIVFVGTRTAAQTYQVPLAFVIMSIFYFAVGYPTSVLLRRLERRVALP